VEYNPHWVFHRHRDGSLHLFSGEVQPISRRQDLPPAFHREGSVYVTRTAALSAQGSLYGRRVLGYEIPQEFSSNIDTLADWDQIEGRMLGKTAGTF
jgi:CMP-N-acetylneuraminic acid synthetase